MRDRHTAIRWMGLMLLISSRAFGAGVDDLRCEYLREPLGVDTPQPRLSWIINSNRRGERQTAYQVLVASSEELLGKDQGDLWDSGKVESGQSVQVEYAGRPLESRQALPLEGAGVGQGRPARLPGARRRCGRWDCSKPEDWTAKWITGGSGSDKSMPHPWLRRNFELKSDVKTARVYVNTPGLYELFINGRKVGDDVLSPAYCQFKKRVFYNVHDVSHLLQKGTNCIALWMGPGWYQTHYGNPYKAPIVRAQLEIESPEGRSVIGTDGQWRAADSCISQVGGWAWNNFGGERYDDGRYIQDWNLATCDDRAWAKAMEVAAPNVTASWQALPGSRTGPADPGAHDRSAQGQVDRGFRNDPHRLGAPASGRAEARPGSGH